MSVADPIPFLDLPRQFASLNDEIDSEMSAVMRACSFINGSVVSEFENLFAQYTGADHCVAVHSGTAALHLALLALDIGPGDEVITAANSFVATAEAIHFAGARTVLADVRPDTRNIDVMSVEKAITKKTRAVIPVHLYGQPADMDELKNLVNGTGIKIVEDACQAHGATYKDGRAGSLADIAAFSFYPGKNLGGAGDGGAVTTNDPDLAERVRLLKDHGSKLKYHHELAGHNFRLDSLQAAVLKVKLPHLDSWNVQRRSHAARYGKNLSSSSKIILPFCPEDRAPVHHLYVVEVPDRPSVEHDFKKSGIGYGIHYPVPIHLQPAFGYLGYHKGAFPQSERLSQSIISLPMFAELSEAQIDRVCEVLLSSCG